MEEKKNAENSEDVEEVTTEIKVVGTVECKRCDGRCNAGGIYRCGKKPVFLDKEHPRYLEPCEIANANGKCSEFKRKPKIVKNLAIRNGAKDERKTGSVAGHTE